MGAVYSRGAEKSLCSLEVWWQKSHQNASRYSLFLKSRFCGPGVCSLQPAAVQLQHGGMMTPPPQKRSSECISLQVFADQSLLQPGGLQPAAVQLQHGGMMTPPEKVISMHFAAGFSWNVAFAARRSAGCSSAVAEDDQDDHRCFYWKLVDSLRKPSDLLRMLGRQKMWEIQKIYNCHYSLGYGLFEIVGPTLCFTNTDLLSFGGVIDNRQIYAHVDVCTGRCW